MLESNRYRRKHAPPEILKREVLVTTQLALGEEPLRVAKYWLGSTDGQCYARKA